MLKNLRYTLQGSVALLVITISTIVATVVLFILSIVKFLLPKGRPRQFMSRLLARVAEFWSSINRWVTGCYRNLEWDVELPAGIEHDKSYLIFCNHQSWVDIVALQHVLNRKAPFMRFLMKQQLIWVPFLGFCWWALDMVFLKRYSREELLKNPELRGKDLENAARTCEKLKHIPVSMMTFPEGTRYTLEKSQKQKSPHRNLLRPRYGGVGQVLYIFGDTLDTVIDVSIVYPHGTPNIWQLLSGQVRKISMHIQLRPIGADIRGHDFHADSVAKARLKAWMNNIWEEKDQYISYALKVDP